VSGKIVNLRSVRKRRDRDAKAAEASENRARHGRSKAEKTVETARRAADDRRHDGNRLLPEDEAPTPG